MRDGNPKKNQKEIPEMKTTVTEMKNVSDRFISRLDMTEERLSEFEIGQ